MKKYGDEWFKKMNISDLSQMDPYLTGWISLESQKEKFNPVYNEDVDTFFQYKA